MIPGVGQFGESFPLCFRIARLNNFEVYPQTLQDDSLRLSFADCSTSTLVLEIL